MEELIPSVLVGLWLFWRIEWLRAPRLDAFTLDDFDHVHPDHGPDWLTRQKS